MQCNNKGCGQIQNPYIDPKTDKVYCSLCDKEISTVTHFAKMQMKASKQYKEKSGKSFSVKCSHCNVEDRPILENKKYSCSGCKKELNISDAFKAVLNKFLPLTNKEI